MFNVTDALFRLFPDSCLSFMGPIFNPMILGVTESAHFKIELKLVVVVVLVPGMRAGWLGNFERKPT